MNNSLSDQPSSYQFTKDIKWQSISKLMWILFLTFALLMIIIVIDFPSYELRNPYFIHYFIPKLLAFSLLTMPMVFIIASGNVDLSIGSNAGFTAILVTYIAGGLDYSLGVAVPFGLLVAGFIGFMIGSLVVFLRLPSVLVTLGVAVVLINISFRISKYYRFPNLFSLKDSVGIGFYGFGLGILFLVAMIYLVVFEIKPIISRDINKTGETNQKKKKGRLLRILPFVFMGFLSGVIGLTELSSGVLGTNLLTDPYIANVSSYSLKIFEFSILVIIAALIGGTIFGNRDPNMIGGILGAFIIGLLNFYTFYCDISSGPLNICSIALNILVPVTVFVVYVYYSLIDDRFRKSTTRNKSHSD